MTPGSSQSSISPALSSVSPSELLLPGRPMVDPRRLAISGARPRRRTAYRLLPELTVAEPMAPVYVLGYAGVAGWVIADTLTVMPGSLQVHICVSRREKRAANKAPVRERHATD